MYPSFKDLVFSFPICFNQEQGLHSLSFSESPFYLFTFGPVCWNVEICWIEEKKSLPLILVVFVSPLIPTSLLLCFSHLGQTWSLTGSRSREGDLHPATSTELQENALLSPSFVSWALKLDCRQAGRNRIIDRFSIWRYRYMMKIKCSCLSPLLPVPCLHACTYSRDQSQQGLQGKHINK